MRDGQKIVFHGEGDQEPGLEPGDIIIVLDQREHPRFTRLNILCYQVSFATNFICVSVFRVGGITQCSMYRLCTFPVAHVYMCGLFFNCKSDRYTEVEA